MNRPFATGAPLGLPRLKLFGALSRTPHGLIDMATPALAALLVLGAFPPAGVTVLGIITVFAGYTAVYALNDVVDFHADREKARLGAIECGGGDLDAVLVRHPMAQGFLTFQEGLTWAMTWASVALVGAYLLNPVCVLVFAFACALEVIYCLLLKVSCLRTLISGAVKSAGAVAAVFAVDPRPSFLQVGVIFFWLFLWEIGGQNVPNDWTDMEEDRRLKAKTIPVRFGPRRSLWIILGCLSGTVALSFPLFRLSPGGFGTFLLAAVLLAGAVLLLVPALWLLRKPSRHRAMALFNRASYYPLVLFFLVVARLLLLPA